MLLIVVGVVMGVVFVRRQRALPHPLLDVGLFRHRAFSVSLGAQTLALFSLGAIQYLIMQYLQLVTGLSPLQAGLWSAGPVFLGVVGALLAPRLAQLTSRVRVVGGGFFLSTVGFVMFFDVLAMNGHDLTGFAYRERRTLLEELVSASPRVQVPPAFETDISAALRTSADQGLEGIVAKRLDSTYRPGQRSSAWIKIRHSRTQEVVVAGWRPGRGSRSDAVGSLMLAVPTSEGGLRYAGRVGTGFTQEQARTILATLRAEERSTSPVTEVPRADAREARWVDPSRVAEVSFSNWTADGRLRHPVWRGWRPDKSPQDVHVEPA